MAEREVLYELRQIGNFVKVSAIDCLTGLEVCIVGDIKAGEPMLQRIARRKLEYVLAKQARERG